MHINQVTIITFEDGESFSTSMDIQVVKDLRRAMGVYGETSKLSAIKLTRNIFRCGLKHAKWFVEEAIVEVERERKAAI